MFGSGRQGASPPAGKIALPGTARFAKERPRAAARFSGFARSQGTRAYQTGRSSSGVERLIRNQ